MVSPAFALSTAFWIVVKSHLPLPLQTVWVLKGPAGLAATGPGCLGSG